MTLLATALFSEAALRFVLLGMATGSLTALVALGIVLVHRTSGVLNFSAGALGGIAAFVFYDIRDDGVPTWWALTFGLVVGVLLGLLTYARAWRRCATPPNSPSSSPRSGCSARARRSWSCAGDSASCSPGRCSRRGS